MSGIFGVISKKECLEDLFYGTDYHSHLGTAFGGIAVHGKDKKIHTLKSGQFKIRFADELPNLKGATSGIGVISAEEPQPISCDSQHGNFRICGNGRINNVDNLAEELRADGWSFAESYYDGEGRLRTNAIEIAGKIIAKEPTVEAGIEKLFEKIDGSLSVLLLADEGIYAARARHGHSPLVIARKGGSWAVATETCGLENLRYNIFKELKPGEIVLLTKHGSKTTVKGTDKNQICSFLWIYTGFPASEYYGINVEEARYRCGAALARQDMKNKNFMPDIVAGVPDSGLAHAIGYAIESGWPFKRPLVKYTDGYGRSYTPVMQEDRDKIAEMKLIVISQIARGKKIVLTEDSIVRGTQLKNHTVTKLYNAGAEEIHIRPACPPLMYPCKFNKSTKELEELAARKMMFLMEGTFNPKNIEDYINPEHERHMQMVELIRKDLNVTSDGYCHGKVKSLAYLRLDDMVEAIGLPREKLCTYCWTGE